MRKRVLAGLLCVVTAVLMISALQVGGEETKAPSPRDVALMGTVVDLHCFMTGKFPSADHAKCTRDCIRAGVPAALETADGLVILGQGPKGPGRTIEGFALEQVEVQGKLYERNGIRYLDLTSARRASAPQTPMLEEEDLEVEVEEPDDAGTDG